MKHRFGFGRKRTRLAQHARRTFLRLESLEPRWLLTDVGGVINSNTTWNVAGSPYMLTDNVFVRGGATLTIDPGVTVTGPFFYDLFVSDNGSGGTLNADDATFNVEVIFGLTGDGTIQNSTVASGSITVNDGASPSLNNNTFHNGTPFYAAPEFVPNLSGRGNIFGTGATIGILGGTINDDTVWPNIADASTYYLEGNVFVRAGATLTVGSGMEIGAPFFNDLLISNDGSGGTLNADDVTFNNETHFGLNGTGTIENSTVASGNITVNDGASPTFDNNTFYGGTPLFVAPEFIPNLDGRGNTFGTGATIGVLGGTINQNTVWPNMADASTYYLEGNVFVRGGATLTVESGMEIGAPFFNDLFISDDGSGGTLNADDVTFNNETHFGLNGTGTIENSTVGTGNITVNEGASPTFTDNTFHGGTPLFLAPEFIPNLDGRGNTFGTGATIGVVGGTINQDTVWPNIAEASIYDLQGNVFVRSGATLTIASGMQVTAPFFNDLLISDDGSGGTLNANGVTFNNETIFGLSGSGLIQNSTVASGSITVNNGASPNFVGNTFHSGRPVIVFPQYVPRLAGNNFNFGATVGVTAGMISTSTTWPVLSGVTTFELTGSVVVTSDAVLTIADGLVVEAAFFNDLLIGASGFGGTLHASFVVFDVDVLFGRDSSGTIENSRFLGEVDLAGTTTTTFDANHFGAASIVRGIANTSGTIDLTNNFWGTSVAADIEAKVLHQPDEANRPLILYEPFLISAPAKANPVITWSDPADIPVGTALSATQLNATANTTGTFVYNPPSGTVLAGGNGQTLGVTFTPSNTLTFNTASAFVEIDVVRADPVITWNDPDDIVFGTALGASELNAVADVPGSFVYTPAAGTILDAGVGQTLSVTFTPSDTAQYNTVTATALINVDKADPIITWSTPGDIVFGTSLSSAQLNATASTPGTFVYSPAAGTLLNAGPGQTLNVDFIPTNTTNFNSVSASVQINVLKADPVLTWTDPAPITVGTPLGASELDATASVPGTFTYSPAAGTLLAFGLDQTLSVNFVPTNFSNFNVASAQVEIDVLKTVPLVSWDDPDEIIFGTALDSTQLNATADIPGTFVYNPAAGTILSAGENQRLSVTFTPTDNAAFDVVTATVMITVLPADSVISWDTPDDIVFGTALSATQLNATSDVTGTFVYTPGAGTVLDVGSDQTLSVTFTPDDLTQHNIAGASVTINVLPADPVISWDAPADIIFGTALSITQLSATSNVAGTFVYTPNIGTLLDAGPGQTLSVTFTPDDLTRYNVADASVMIDVLQAEPVLSWDEPADIIVGTALDETQLNASADVSGTFTYDPASGTVLPGGDDQLLSVMFVPDDDNFKSVSATVQIDVLDNLDFGDAPDSFLVTVEEEGPRHLIGSLFLGTAIDRDLNGRPSATAMGDDLDAEGDDEDGFGTVADIVTTTGAVTVSSFVVTSSAAGKLDAWIDFDGNGTFAHPGEHLAGGVSYDVVPGENLISFDVPSGATVGESVLRLRLSSAGGLAPGGFAEDGEVEDHSTTILDGDAVTGATVDAPGNVVTLVVTTNGLSVQDDSDELFIAPTANVNSINLPGSDEDDVFTLDFTGGNVLPNGGLTMDGGGGQDVVRLVGPGSDLDLTDPNIEITNVETIDMTAPDASIVTVDAPSIMALTPTGSAGFVGGSGDMIVFVDKTEWLMSDPIIEGETFMRTVVNGDAMVEADLPAPYQNLAQRHDVTNDGNVRASDALRVINELGVRSVSDRASGAVVDPLSVATWPGVYFDTSGDDRISALDALQVINQLARQGLSGAGESEQVPPNLLIEPAEADGSDANDALSAVTRQILDEKVQSSTQAQSSQPAQFDARQVSVEGPTDSPSETVNAVDELLSDEAFLAQIAAS